MRIKTILAKILALKQTRIRALHLEPEGLVLDVAPSTRVPVCSGCCKRVGSVHDTYEGRRWRHLDMAGMRLWLRYAIRRVRCRRCGVTVELVPWAEAQSWFTFDFEQHVAYLAQRADKTTISAMMRIGWATVGSIIERVVARSRPEDALDNLHVIGVDELSYRRHHEYVTVVIDHERGAVVWAHEGKDADTLRAFFLELGEERCAQLEAVTLDLSAAYIKAVTEASPKARLIFDRFHVQRLAHDALDTVRRQQWRAAEPEDKKAIKGTRFALQKNPWNLTDVEYGKLTEVQRTNRPLYRAYLLKETLAKILDGAQVNVARDKLLDWTAWAARSRLPPFRKVARTIKQHIEGIVAYVATGLSSGRSEGLNGKIRTITRRSFGFHSASSLIALMRNRAKELIEDFMIAANGVTARYLDRKKFPSLRRVLRSPERWAKIVTLAESLGESLPPEPSNAALEELLLKRRDADPTRFADLSLSVVKLLGRGEYDLELPGQPIEGHFGLALHDYTHSTAPNRRFPDLITQRLLKASMAGHPAPYTIAELRALAAHCTEQEDNATKTERRVRKSAAALLLSSHVGQHFDAFVTGASPKGTYVRISHPAAEGRLIRGEHGLSVGDRLRVALVHTDFERGFVDFARA